MRADQLGAAPAAMFMTTVIRDRLPSRSHSETRQTVLPVGLGGGWAKGSTIERQSYDCVATKRANTDDSQPASRAYKLTT